jgi:hypothetical protein
MYDEKTTPSHQVAGIENLQDTWRELCREEGTGILLLLESTKNSFRHTTWRWFHLASPEWAVVSLYLPTQFRCVMTLTDSLGTTVESDNYPLRRDGVGDSSYVSNTLWMAPFFINDYCLDFYIPEVTLTKSIVVLPDDVKRVTDFTATIEEVRKKAN